jgi:hypothetical protein
MARPYMEGKKLPDEKYALILRVSMREEELDRARQLETDLRKEAKLAEAALEALQQENAELTKCASCKKALSRDCENCQRLWAS